MVTNICLDALRQVEGRTVEVVHELLRHAARPMIPIRDIRKRYQDATRSALKPTTRRAPRTAGSARS